METSSGIDSALGAVVQEGRAAADSILDFREAALSRTNASQCVSCYFKIFKAVRSSQTKALQTLRQWIEQHLVVVVRGDKAEELEQLPIQLEGDTLQDYCHKMINTLRFDRAYPGSRLELQFEYADQRAA